jgi:hypothetical protein
MTFETWECFARPASTGKRCGHVNTSASYARVFFTSERRILYCESCGCTKIASDDRRKKEKR